MLQNLFCRAERLVRKDGHTGFAITQKLNHSRIRECSFGAMLPVKIRIDLMNHFNGNARTDHVFRECRLPHAPLNQLHGTVPDKGPHTLFVMFRKPEMAQRKIHRHGKVTEGIEQSPVQVKNNEGFVVKHGGAKFRNLFTARIPFRPRNGKSKAQTRPR